MINKIALSVFTFALFFCVPIIERAGPLQSATAQTARTPRIGMPDVLGIVRISNRGFVRWNARWPTTVIPVCWEQELPQFQRERELVRQALQETWERYSPIQFVNWGECGPFARGVRISVQDDGPRTNGLGRELDAMPGGVLLNFSFLRWRQPCHTAREDCIRSIAVHEFGHVVGFAHEQNRPDTPGGCPGPQGENGDWLLTPWDPISVMNYCNMNGNGSLSPGDIASVRMMYS